MIPLQWVKPFAVVCLVGTMLFGAPAFYTFVFGVILLSLANPQAYLGLLFFSGPLKNAPLIHRSPLDLTLFSYLLFFAFFVNQRIGKWSISRNAMIMNGVLLFCLLSVLLSMSITPAPWDYLSRSGIFIVIFYLPLVFLILNLPREQVRESAVELLKISLVIGYAWLGLGLHNELTGNYQHRLDDPNYLVDHLSAFGEDYMIFSSFVVILYVEAFVQLLYKKNYIINGLLVLVLTFAIVNSPARGLTIGLLLAALALTAIWLHRFTINKLIVVLTAPVLLFILLAVYTTFFVQTRQSLLIQRLVDFSPKGTSISHRIEAIKLGWEHWKENPFLGSGTDSVAFFSGDPGYYTHNLFLEIVFEYGLLGGLPLLVLLALMLISFTNLTLKETIPSRSVEGLWLMGIFIVFFSFGMFSGTMGNMRQLWILLAMVTALGLARRDNQFSYRY